MEEKLSIKCIKPTPLLLRTVRINYKDLAKHVAKGIIAASASDWKNASQQAIDALSSMSLADSPSELAWTLVSRSITKSLYHIIEEGTHFTLKDEQEIQSSLDSLTDEVTTREFVIDKNFFFNPRNFQDNEAIQQSLREFLERIGVPAAQSTAISARYPGYFVKCVYDEWKSNKDKYNIILKEIESPFSEALERELSWKRYFSWLRKQISEPMLEEAFGLEQIYVPLRAYIHKINSREDFQDLSSECMIDSEETTSLRYIVMLDEAIHKWISNKDKRDYKRVICGGPGCGKSSLAKMLAAKLAEKEIKTIFIPLHMIDAEEDFIKSVGDYIIRGDLLPYNPLEDDDECIVLILDGLDELTMQGKTGVEAAKRFIGHVLRIGDTYNNQKLRLQILITGRDLVVQTTEKEYRLQESTLNVLPYFIRKDMLQGGDIEDKDNLLAVDQRDDWWISYGKSTGDAYEGIPKELKLEKLEEVTGQPLLNYLIALTYKRNTKHFSAINLNTIYENLLNSVYERAWADKRRPWVNDLSQSQFYSILEEIAVSVWHGDGRKTTVADVTSRCKGSKSAKLIEKFQDGAEKGLIRLLTAFYFRRAICRGETETYEFTHKSFGEYLASRRIVRTIDYYARQFEQSETDLYTTWNEREALHQWVLNYGPKEIDKYLYSFLIDEVARNTPENVDKWQDVACKCISHSLRYGMPMELLAGGSFYEQIRQSRNAEETLLAILNACSLHTKRLSAIDWPSPTSLGEWISRLQPQRPGPVNTLSYSCFSNIIAKNQTLDMADCYRINMMNSILTKSQFFNANLMIADLRSADLGHADMRHAQLESAKLENASLVGADLRSAFLSQANLHHANLNGANLSRVILNKSNLVSSTLVGATLSSAIIVDSDLRQADFSKSDCSSVNFRGSDLRGANLSGAKLTGAIFKSARIDGVIMDDKILKIALKQGALITSQDSEIPDN